MQLILLTLAVWTTFAEPASIAQTEDYEKLSLSQGVFFTDQETNTRFDSSGGAPGTEVGLEE